MIRINSDSVNTKKIDGQYRLVARKDFIVNGTKIAAGTIGGRIFDCKIEGNSWISYDSSAVNTYLVNSCILHKSDVQSCEIYNSTILSTKCTSSIIVDSIITYSTVVESLIQKSSIGSSQIRDCGFLNISSTECKLDSVIAVDMIIQETKLSNITIDREGLRINHGEIAIFNAFWDNGETFFYHIPSKTWYMNNFSGCNEAFLNKICEKSLDDYLMYKKYMDFVEKL